MLGILKRLLRHAPETSSDADLSRDFQARYAWFKELLSSNTEVLNLITDMEEKLQCHALFGMAYIRSSSTRAVFHTTRMIKCLNAISKDKYSLLYDSLKTINCKIEAEIDKKTLSTSSDDRLVIPYAEIDREMVDLVGGKNANLGEVTRNAGLPVPDGFAITTRAFHLFINHKNLLSEIHKIELEIKHNDLESIHQVSEKIQSLISEARIPAELEQAILDIYDAIQQTEEMDSNLRLAMRSSAVGEDSSVGTTRDSTDHRVVDQETVTSPSYAGQYASMLNVTRENMVQTYKNIVASLYRAHAISYRLNKGIRDEDIIMSVGCLRMLDARVSGVIYTRHPFNILDNNIIISASWGLGSYIVSGIVSPDVFTVAKNPPFDLISCQISPKTILLENAPNGGVVEKAVEQGKQGQPCLEDAQIKALAQYAVTLENHFGCPQDIEWALDRSGKLYILQSRPLQVVTPESSVTADSSKLEKYPLLVEGGAVAFSGVGYGKAFFVRSDADLQNFPDGAVLVAEHSSPKFMLAMPKAEAIITNSGSVTGHMASLAREFSIPTVLNLVNATSLIKPGMSITVDAFSGRVYEGKAVELLAARLPRRNQLRNTPVVQTLKKVSEYVIPLHLLDTKADNFTPLGCTSLHDITRFVHEMSYALMFKMSDRISSNLGTSIKLDVNIPLDLYLIDLGGGLMGLEKNTRKVRLYDVISLPLIALMKGMLNEHLQSGYARPVQLKGFFSVVTNQMLSAPPTSERFGNRSYAIISDKYLNFSSRVGYHYSILDCYCGLTTNKNYITFSFKGGAADDIRRYRRARAIAIMLSDLGFSVLVNGDRVDGQFRKYEASMITEKLEMLGRLLQFTRQLDMLMSSEASVEEVASAFRRENYNFSSEH